MLDEKTIEIKKKSLEAEENRLKIICNKVILMHELYVREKAEWEKKQKRYLDDIEKMEKSISSGEEFIANVKKELGYEV